jgi:hypothetical protein
MFQVVTFKGIAQIYDADDGFSNVMAGIVAAIHLYLGEIANRRAQHQLW